MESNPEYIAYIFDKYRDTVYRLAFSRVKNVADAEDIFQQVFLKLIKNINKLENEEHIKHWLIRVTINLSKSHFSSVWHKNREALDENIPSEIESCETLMSVMSLPKKYRTVIHLHYYEGYSCEEIAELLGVSNGTVRTRLFRARAALKESLKEEFENV